MKKSLLSLIFLLPIQFLLAQNSALTNLPTGSVPEEVGKRLGYHFVGARHDLYTAKYIHYAEVCTSTGALMRK